MANVRSELDDDPERLAEMREQMLEFAQCMRDHGIDMPDPTFDENGRIKIDMAPGEGRARHRRLQRRRRGVQPGRGRSDDAGCTRRRRCVATEDARRAADVRGWIIVGVATVPSPAPSPPGSSLTSGKGDEAGAAPTATPRRRSWRPSSGATSQRPSRSTARPGTASRAARARRQRHADRAPPGRRRDRAGHVVAEVDGRPIVALQGPLPMWRALGPASTTARTSSSWSTCWRRSATPTRTASMSTRTGRAQRPTRSRRSRRTTAWTTTAPSTSATSC